ncbi:glycoside hydrolase family 16 protein [Pseudohyphozyma bogoriensis]|nr:glycoside hydrolase family 16 protein [Pseudohyphozyma bogoriensis]
MAPDTFHNSPTLESLYSDNLDVEFQSVRESRYSMALPSRPFSQTSSYSDISCSAGSGVSTSNSANPILPAASHANYGGIYSIEKEKWEPEDDDDFHDAGKAMPRVGPSRMIQETKDRSFWSWRGILNVAAVVLLLAAVVGVFAGYPVASALTSTYYVNTTGYISGTPSDAPDTSTGVVINYSAPNITTRTGLIDPDTDSSVYTKVGADGTELTLVFSDEFNTDGRTFYADEDPFFEAVNLHYWSTDDMEWYDPDQITTEDGYLAITFTNASDTDSHGLGYLGGMLQSWNKFCFTGGRIEVAVSLPGTPTDSGFWPAVWVMGNIGRPGYGSTLEGTWPYTYESCDVGTLANQTLDGLPKIATTSGTSSYDYELSYLPGQKLSACTCPGEDHPGPTLSNGSFTGRGACEIDIFEASTGTDNGYVSQSAQWAPFNPYYYILNDTTAEVDLYTNASYDTYMNTYLGGAYQQASSGVSNTVSSTYNSTTDFSVYGVDYTPTYMASDGVGKIYWINNGENMWRITDKAMAANEEAEVSGRPVCGYVASDVANLPCEALTLHALSADVDDREPMSIIANLGMSTSFTTVDVDSLTFPAKMRIDYIRVYQPADQINVGCDPALYPTADYISNHAEAYNNPNLTTWAQYDNST